MSPQKKKKKKKKKKEEKEIKRNKRKIKKGSGARLIFFINLNLYIPFPDLLPRNRHKNESVEEYSESTRSVYTVDSRYLELAYLE